MERREETLLNYGKQVKEKRELAKQMIQDREDTQWDYQPKINKRSAKIIQERSQIMVLSPKNQTSFDGEQENDRSFEQNILNGLNKFSNLYEDAMMRQERQQKVYSMCIDKECTFKPRMVSQESKLSKIYSQNLSINQSQAIVSEQKPYNEGKTSDVDLRNAMSQLKNHPPTVTHKNDKSVFANPIIKNDENIDP